MQLKFNAKCLKIGSRCLVVLPLEISVQLPSRGMVMVTGTVNSTSFLSPAEPDGKGSHWIEVSEKFLQDANIGVDGTVSIAIDAINDWPAPEMPADIMDAIEQAGLLPQWFSVTTKAQWEWLRWIRSTSNPETRSKRIQVACSKLEKGSKRPCCFDASRCTVQDVSKSGILLTPNE